MFLRQLPPVAAILVAGFLSSPLLAQENPGSTGPEGPQGIQADRGDILDTARDFAATVGALHAPFVEKGKTFALSPRWTQIDGDAHALGLSGAVRLNDSVQIDAGLAYGLDEDSAATTVGATFSW